MEIESKVLDVDKKAIRRRLEALGAELTFDGTHDAYHFDTKDRRLGKEKSLLRLRREKDANGERVTMTFKRRVKGTVAKRAHEHEVVVSSFAAAERIVEGLGLHAVRRGKKRRAEYRLGKVHYCLDTIPGIPTYLEIEAPSERAVVAGAKRLGIGKKALKPWSLRDVLRHYGKKDCRT